VKSKESLQEMEQEGGILRRDADEKMRDGKGRGVLDWGDEYGV
jgi:hypothetical protein